MAVQLLFKHPGQELQMWLLISSAHCEILVSSQNGVSLPDGMADSSILMFEYPSGTKIVLYAKV